MGDDLMLGESRRGVIIRIPIVRVIRLEEAGLRCARGRKLHGIRVFHHYRHPLARADAHPDHAIACATFP